MPCTGADSGLAIVPNIQKSTYCDGSTSNHKLWQTKRSFAVLFIWKKNEFWCKIMKRLWFYVICFDCIKWEWMKPTHKDTIYRGWRGAHEVTQSKNQFWSVVRLLPNCRSSVHFSDSPLTWHRAAARAIVLFIEFSFLNSKIIFFNPTLFTNFSFI